MNFNISLTQYSSKFNLESKLQKQFWFFFSYFHFHQPRMSRNADLPILSLVSHSIITLLSLITLAIIQNIPITL